MPQTRRSQQARPVVTYANGEFRRNDRPHRILAGALHYFRVHPDLWADRLRRLAAMGLNTVDTYIAWNFHQPQRSEPADFDGWRDIERFIRTAGEIGLDVIIRPGPYICAEWDNGGFPAWLTADAGVRPRRTNPRFEAYVAEWFDVLLPRLVPLQARFGGSIIACQIENEYGSYGDDREYMQWMHEAIVSRGIIEHVFTADGPTVGMQDGGTLPGVMASATLGSRAGQAAGLLRSRRPDEPFFVAEYWDGWFDHWSENHHTRDTNDATMALGEILDERGSVSIYMAHGGTNFGLASGANHDAGSYQPTVTSYDSDAPIAEDGRPTAKFHAMRDLLSSVTGDEPPQLPPEPATLPPSTVDLERIGDLLPATRLAGTATATTDPLTFERLGLDAGLVLYRASVQLPGNCTVTLENVRDRAYVFVDGRRIGVVDRNGPAEVDVQAGPGTAELEILVENQGRINYGPLLGQGKGLDGVRIDRRYVFGWTMVPVALDRVFPESLAVGGTAAGTATSGGVHAGEIAVDDPSDTHIRLSGYTKGFLWVNDFLLGRYWNVGPQQTLYVPGPLLYRGRNSVTVLELEHGHGPVELCDRPVLANTAPHPG